MKPKTILLLVVAAIFAIILFQNMTPLYFQILFWSIQVPKLVLVLVSIFLGWVIGRFTHLAYGSEIKQTVDQGSEKTEVPEEA